MTKKTSRAKKKGKVVMFVFVRLAFLSFCVQFRSSVVRQTAISFFFAFECSCEHCGPIMYFCLGRRLCLLLLACDYCPISFSFSFLEKKVPQYCTPPACNGETHLHFWVNGSWRGGKKERIVRSLVCLLLSASHSPRRSFFARNTSNQRNKRMGSIRIERII